MQFQLFVKKDNLILNRKISLRYNNFIHFSRKVI